MTSTDQNKHESFWNLILHTLCTAWQQYQAKHKTDHVIQDLNLLSDMDKQLRLNYHPTSNRWTDGISNSESGAIPANLLQLQERNLDWTPIMDWFHNQETIICASNDHSIQE